MVTQRNRRLIQTGRRQLAAAALSLLLATPVPAQLGGKSVTEDAGPVSELSTNVSNGSRPVHESGRTTHESSVGPLSGNSTHESSTGPMTSGTMSDITVGSVTSSRSLRRERNEARLAPAPPRMAPDGAVEQPLMWEPVYELDGLVEELGAIEPMERLDDSIASDEAAMDEPAAEEQGMVPAE